MLEDSGSKFKLNFDWEWVENSDKSQNSKKNCIKVFNVLSNSLKKKECLLSFLKSYDFFTFISYVKLKNSSKSKIKYRKKIQY